MKILDRLKNFLPEREVVRIKEVEIKSEEPTKVIAPVFKEIAPERNLSKLLKEGVFSWSFMAMNAISEEVMHNPIKLFNKTTGKEIEKHAVLHLIDKPNELQTTSQFLWQVMMMLMATGEAPILTSGKNPTNMALLNPNRLKMNFIDGKISNYQYTQSNGVVQPIENPEDLVFLKIPTLDNPFRGDGVLKYIVKTLDLDDFIETYLVNFFYNDATPGAVLETDKELNQGIIDRLKQQFKVKYQGVKNAHKLAVLEKGLKWKETSSKISDMQLTDNQGAIRDKILAAFKVPKSILGITEDVNRANGENSDRVFAKRAVKPKLLAVQEQFNTFLLPLFAGTENMELIFDNPVKEDEKLQAEIDQIYINAGVITVDETRESMGLAPMKEEDKPEPEEKPEPKEEEEEEEEKQIKSADPIKNLVLDVLQAESNKLKKRFTHREVEKFHEEKIFNNNDIEARYKEKLGKLFKRFGLNITKQLSTKTKKQLETFNFQEKEQQQAMAEVSAPFIEEALIRQSGLTYAFLGLDDKFTSQDDFVKEFVASRTLKMSVETSETTRSDVERILRDWGKEEESVADLKKRLKLYFNETKRSEMISRTEVSRASGEATSTIYKETGAVGKQWITARDERVCQFCGPMNNKIIPINKNFWNKGGKMIGDSGGTLKFKFESVKQFPLHPQCRCDLIPVFDEIDVPKKSLDYQEVNKTKSDYIDKQAEEKKELKKLKKDIDSIKEEVEGEKEMINDQAKSNKEVVNKLKEKEGELKEKEKKLKKDIKEFEEIKL